MSRRQGVYVLKGVMASNIINIYITFNFFFDKKNKNTIKIFSTEQSK